MKKSKITIEPATRDYINEFYGERVDQSLKGFVGLLSGRVVGVAGISYNKGSMVLFSDIKDEVRPFKRDIVKAFLKIKELVLNTNFPIVAVADKNENLSELILTKMGFTESGNTQSDGSKIFWRKP